MLPLVAPAPTIGYLDTRYLRISQNLADLNNVATARTNLGLGSMAVVNDAAADGNYYTRRNNVWAAVTGGALLPVVDETALVYKTGTPASTLTFDVTAYSAARVVTWPDAALTVAGLEVANVFTAAQTIKVNTATNNAVLPVGTLGANVTGAGVGAAGFGPGVIFTGESSTTVDQNMAQVAAVWRDATHASRGADIVFSTVYNAAALAEAMRLRSYGELDLAPIALAGNNAALNASYTASGAILNYSAMVKTAYTTSGAITGANLFFGLYNRIDIRNSSTWSGFGYGMLNESYLDGTGSAGGALGGAFWVNVGSISGPSTRSAITGLEAKIIFFAQTHNATNAILCNLAYTNTPAGTITNAYGLKIGDVSIGGTLNYSIYTGAGLVRHGDQQELEEVDTIVGATADGYAAALTLDPGYTAATAQTVTRHNYIDVQNVSVAGAGPAAVTDACVLRFDANAGTHKAVDGSSIKATPTAVDAWVKINCNGTLMYIPAYISKVA